MASAFAIINPNEYGAECEKLCCAHRSYCVSTAPSTKCKWTWEERRVSVCAVLAVGSVHTHTRAPETVYVCIGGKLLRAILQCVFRSCAICVFVQLVWHT